MTHTHPTSDSATNPNDADRVRAACQDLIAASADITFTAVAQATGISRATCYRRRDLRAIIDAHRSRQGELLTLTALICRALCQVGRVRRCPRPSSWTPPR